MTRALVLVLALLAAGCAGSSPAPEPVAASVAPATSRALGRRLVGLRLTPPKVRPAGWEWPAQARRLARKGGPIGPAVVRELNRLGITVNGVYTPPSSGLSSPLTANLDAGGYSATSLGGLSFGTNKSITATGQLSIELDNGDLNIDAGPTSDTIYLGSNNGNNVVTGGNVSLASGKFLLGGFSGAQAVAGAATTVPTSTDTALDLSTETYDTDTYHDNSTNNSRLTAPRDGYYFVTGEVAGADTSDYTIVGYVKRNGTIVGRSAQRIASGGGQLGLTVTSIVSMTSGQYVELFAWQNSGADRSVVAQRFTITFMGTR